MTDTNKINGQELENVTGGNDGLVNGSWVYGTVHGVIHYDSTACLTLRNAPDGAVMYTDAGKAMGWQNGDTIAVQPSSRTGNWIRANYGGCFGWVNTNYVYY